MSFDPVRLAMITSAQGFSLWRYDTGEELQRLLDPAYFAAASGMLRRGDLIFATCTTAATRTTSLLLITSVKEGLVVVEALRGDSSEALALFGNVSISSAEDGEVLTFVDGAWTNRANSGAAGDVHAALVGNPHNATAADLGAIPQSAMGQPLGVATLDADGRLNAALARIPALDELRDVEAGSPQPGDVLKFSGGSWKSAVEAGAAGDAFAASHAGSGGSAHASATATQAGFLAAADKAKLDGIQAGAQVNAVTSVAGRTGAVVVTKTDVGLGSVTNAAQLTRSANDWSGFPVKSAPSTADKLLIEDAAASGAKKTIAIGALPSSGGGGEANTASNVNTAGVGVFKQKAGVNLEFRGVKAGSARVSVAATDSDTCIGIDVAEQHLRLDNIGGSLKDGGAHGTQGGGSLHAVATPSSAGFMTPQDKAKLDGIEAGATAAGVAGDGFASSHPNASTAHTAASIGALPTGNITATNVQAALAELDSKKQPFDATLEALAGLDAATGTVYQTGADTFTKKTDAQMRALTLSGDQGNMLTDVKFWSGSRADYDAIPSKNANIIYFIEA